MDAQDAQKITQSAAVEHGWEEGGRPSHASLLKPKRVGHMARPPVGPCEFVPLGLTNMEVDNHATTTST